MKLLIWFVLFSIFVFKTCKSAPHINFDEDKNGVKVTATPISANNVEDKEDKNDEENNQPESATKIPENFKQSSITYSNYVNNFLDEQNNLPERPLADDDFRWDLVNFIGVLSLLILFFLFYVLILQFFVLECCRDLARCVDPM